MNEMLKEKVLRTLTGCVLLLIVIGGLVMMYPNYRRAESLKRQNAELQETIDRKKKEIEGLYNVTVVDVNTMRYAGKRSRRYTKAGLIKGQKNSFKKAVVTLKEGETIDFYSNI